MEGEFCFPTNQFTVADYVVFAGVLAISAGIGIFYGLYEKQKSMEDYMLGGRQLSAVPVSLSLLASFMSAITLLGTPAEIYVYGTQYMIICFGYVVTIAVAAHLFCPIFYNLRLTSVYEYIERRFDKGLRFFSAIFFVIQTLIYMAIVLYAPSLALNAVTGLNVWISVCIVGCVCIFYTSIGGMKAVIWTDSFQIIMMFAGLLAILIKGSKDFGGFHKVWNILKDGERVEFWNFDPDPTARHTVWTLTIGGAFTWTAIYGVNQAQIQRALGVSTLGGAQLAYWLNLIGLCAIAIICSLCGAVVYAQYAGCHPMGYKNGAGTNRINAKDQLLPLYVMESLGDYQGLPGLFTACLFSGALSTLSSGLNSLAAITLHDMVCLLCVPGMTDARATLVSKCLGVIYGAIMIGLTFIVANMGGMLQAALGLFGMIGGPTLGLFSLGMLYPCVNRWGAWAGFVTSLALTLWLGLGNFVASPPVPQKPYSNSGCAALYPCPWTNGTEDQFTGSTFAAITSWNTSQTSVNGPEYTGWVFYEISYLYYATFAVLVCHSVGLTVSFLTGSQDVEEVDRRLLSPVVSKVWRYLKNKARKINTTNEGKLSNEDIYSIKTLKPVPCYSNGAFQEDPESHADTFYNIKFSTSGGIHTKL